MNHYVPVVQSNEARELVIVELFVLNKIVHEHSLELIAWDNEAEGVELELEMRQRRLGFAERRYFPRVALLHRLTSNSDAHR